MRFLIKCLSLALGASLLFSACATTGRPAQSAGASQMKPASEMQNSSASASTDLEKNIVKMMIPSNQEVLGKMLNGLAEQQNVDLKVRVGANEPRYTLELAEALAGKEPPDLYWLPGEFAARATEAVGKVPYDLSQAATEMGLRAVAQMSPEGFRLLDSQKVYGLPMGLYAEGTLVNLPVLAALLGSKDMAALQRDLIACSYEEWRVMQQAVSDYLEKPGQYQYTLGEHPYSMPGYRPEEAAHLRGIWATATVGPGSYAQNGLGAVFAAGFIDSSDYLDSDPALTNQILKTPLESLYDNLEFETLRMTGKEGALARGEEFSLEVKITAEEARQLFVDGAALFWKGDTQQALQIMQKNHDLKDKLFIIPTKMPYVSKDIAVSNTLYGAAADGYLCLRGKEQANGAPGRLLTQLFTDPARIAAIENELFLLPYTDLYPSQPLLATLEKAVGVGDYYQLPLSQEALATTQGSISEWIGLNLMGKEVWAAEDKAAFMTAIQGAIGALAEQGETDETEEPEPEEATEKVQE